MATKPKATVKVAANMTPESASSKADAGADETAPAKAPAAPKANPAYVACWALRCNGKHFAEGEAVPDVSEAETASLLAVGAIGVADPA